MKIEIGGNGKIEFSKSNSDVASYAMMMRPTDLGYVKTGVVDIARIPFIPLGMKFAENLFYSSDVLRTVIRSIVWETFRNGLYIEEKFQYKCMRCGAEYNEPVEKCVVCGSTDFRPPSKKERERLEKWIEKVNLNEQNLIEVLQDIDFDINIYDNAYVIVRKRYFFNDDGEIIGAEPVEVIRGDVHNIKLIMSNDGRRGYTPDGNGIVMFCPEHRDQMQIVSIDEFRAKDGKIRCPVCGKQMMIGYAEFTKGGKRIFLGPGEILHVKKFTHGIGYGYPMPLTLAMKILILMKQDYYVLMSYHIQRPPKGILILRANRDAVAKAWQFLEEATRTNPWRVVPLVIEGTERLGSKRVAEWIDMSLKIDETTLMNYRDELRRSIGCYDEETEVLVKGKGFVKYTDVDVGDYVLAFDKETGRLEWKKVMGKYVYDYDGIMYHLKSKTYDLMVSPEHRVLFFDEKMWNPIEKRIGEERGLRGYYPQAGRDWKGNRFDGIEIVVGRDRRKIKIDGKLLLKFAGLYVAEGWRSKDKNYKIFISQSKERGRWDEVKSIVESLGINYYIRDIGNGNYNFVINSKELHEWLAQFGDGAGNKRVPEWVKELDREYLERFIEGYWIGDGSKRKYRNNGGVVYRFVTKSKNLADDLQEILIKLGYSANLRVNNRGYYVLDTRVNRNGEIKWYSCIRKRHINKVMYRGKIWDVNIGGGYFVVRRNGKVAISGNSAYGVMPIFQGDMSVGSGLANQGLQITVTNRAVEQEQKIFNEKVIPWILKQIGITDWVVKLKPHEEKDLTAQTQRELMRIQKAQQLIQMGYKVKLIEGPDGIDFEVEGLDINTEFMIRLKQWLEQNGMKMSDKEVVELIQLVNMLGGVAQVKAYLKDAIQKQQMGQIGQMLGVNMENSVENEGVEQSNGAEKEERKDSLSKLLDRLFGSDEGGGGSEQRFEGEPEGANQKLYGKNTIGYEGQPEMNRENMSGMEGLKINRKQRFEGQPEEEGG